MVLFIMFDLDEGEDDFGSPDILDSINSFVISQDSFIESAHDDSYIETNLEIDILDENEEDEETVDKKIFSTEYVKSQKEDYILYVSVDTEYDSATKDVISLQASVRYWCPISKKAVETIFIVFNEKYRSFVLQTFPFEQRYFNNTYINIFFSNFDSLEDVLTNYLFFVLNERQFFDQDLTKVDYTVFLFFFFSITDLIICFGYDNLKPFLLGEKISNHSKKQGKISHKRNIRGFLIREYYSNENRFLKFRYVFRNLFGWNTFGGLKTIINSMGLAVNKEKDLMDPYKEKMENGLYERPFDFLNYALNDACVLHEIVESKMKFLNKMIFEIYFIDSSVYFFTKRNIPYTLGSLVYRIFQLLFYCVIFKNKSDVLLILSKHSMLNPLSKDYVFSKESLELISNISNFQDFKNFKKFDFVNFSKSRKILTCL